MSDDKPATVGELRSWLKDLADDEPIFVDGYEGGYDRPRLTQARLKTLKPWVGSGGSYTGVWGEDRFGNDGPLVWVLTRTPDYSDD